MTLPQLTLTPIGVIHTPFKDRYRAPRQPGAGETGETAEGTVTLAAGKNFEQALQDLAGFEKVWLLYWFDRNTTWKPKVLPPRGPRVRRGVFGTRSPHRPNPLGLTLATLVAVSGRTLRVRDIDLLDGTPILDIKPYLPYAEAFPEARMGWLAEVHTSEQRPAYSVRWSVLAQKQLEWLRGEHGIDLRTHAEAVLARDPTPHPYRRISAAGTKARQLAIKSWRLRFTVRGKQVLVREIASGYARKVIDNAPAGALHDHAAHVAFQQCWAAKARRRPTAAATRSR